MEINLNSHMLLVATILHNTIFFEVFFKNKEKYLNFFCLKTQSFANLVVPKFS